MCGLVGMANLNKYSSATRGDWFKMALIVDQLRGKHSTGVAVLPHEYPKKEAKPMMYKAAVDSTTFCELEPAKKLLKAADSAAIVIGHNRYATMGKIIDDHAHPFMTDNICLVHNGTLDNRIGLKDVKHHEIDSAHICRFIHHAENEDQIVKMLETIEGAYALIWWNLAEKKLYITRNDERELYIGYGDKHKSMFWASEDWMIEPLMKRGYNFNQIAHKPFLIEDGVLYSCSFDEKAETLELQERKYNPKPTWSYLKQSGYGYANKWYYDDLDTYEWNNYSAGSTPPPANTGTMVVDRRGTAIQSPVKVGDEIMIDKWDWEPYKKKSDKGSIIGAAADYNGVSVIIPNVPLLDWNEFVEFYNRMYDQSPDHILPMAVGKISSIDQIKNKTAWVVTIPYNTLWIDEVDILDLPADEDIDSFTEDDDVIDVDWKEAAEEAMEATTEKK